MKLHIIALCAAVAASACTNADRFNGMDGAGADGATGPGIMGHGLAGADNPRSAAYFQQTVGDRVLFAVDQSSISAQYKAVLDGQAQWLLVNTDYRAVIEGHADEQGTREYNLALGERRANAVREYLVSRGVAANRLRTISYGKERPLEVCATEACYSKNRRAVTVLSASLGS